MQYPNIPDHLNKFIEKTNQNQLGTHNVYMIESIDKDGNVTNRAYGLNTMTYAGFNNVYTADYDWPYDDSYSSNWRGWLFLGDGTTITKADETNSSQSNVIKTSAYIVDVYTETEPDIYDPNTDIISSTEKMIQWRYDYNISGVNSDYTFSEFCICRNNQLPSASNPAYLHALVYDEHGQPTTFTKKLNERLYITMYMIFSMKSQIITDMYNHGIYFAGTVSGCISTHDRSEHMCYEYKSPMYELQIYDEFDNDDYIFNSLSAPADIDIRMQNTEYIGSYTIEKTYNSAISTLYFVRGNYDYFRGFGFFVEDELLSTPEELTSEIVYVDNVVKFTSPPNTKLTIRGSFGGFFHTNITPYLNNYCNINWRYTNYGVFPVANFNMQSSYMYNHSTKAWDIAETIDSQSNCYFNNTFSSPQPICVVLNGVITTAYVYVNPRPDIPILYFNSGSLPPSSPMWATDSYWDTSTWEQITSPSSTFPTALQTKKYYISKTLPNSGSYWNYNDGRIFPERKQDYPTIVVQTGAYVMTTLTDINTSSDAQYIMLASDAGNWILTRTKLVYPDVDVNPIVHDMPSTNMPSTSAAAVDQFISSYGNRWSTDDRIIIGDVGGAKYDGNSWKSYNYDRIRIYSVSDDGTAPTYTDIRFDFGIDPHSVNLTDKIFYTFNGSKYLVASYHARHIVGFLDIYGIDDVSPEVTTIQGNCAFGQVIYGSNYMVYHESVTATAPTTILADSMWRLYDMSTKTVVDSFQVPSDYIGATIEGVDGFNTHFYIRITKNSNAYMFYYNTQTHSLSIMEGINDPGLSSFLENTSDRDAMLYGGYYNSGRAHHTSCMYISGYNTTSSDRPNYGYMYTDDDPMHPTNNMFTTDYDKRWRYLYLPKIWETTNGEHLICTTPSLIGSYGRAHVFDFGYFLDTKKTIFYPIDQLKFSNAYMDGTGYYKNGIIHHVSTAGSLNWYPIERFLAHKVTGTTTTIQTYNNPRVISGGSFAYYCGLRDNLWSYSNSNMTADRFGCVYPPIRGSQNYELSITTTGNALLVAMVFSIDSTIDIVESGWNFFGQYTRTYSGQTTLHLTVYTKSVSAGTYTFTSKEHGTAYSAFHPKLMKIDGAVSISLVSNDAVSSSPYTPPVGTGKRRLMAVLCSANSNFYDWFNINNYKLILPASHSQFANFSLYYNPDATDTSTRTYTYRNNSYPGTGYVKWITFDINEA